MAWKLRGTYVETCSCDFFCPCNFNLANGADYDRCRVTFVFNITDGDVDGTDVGGLVVVVIADTPKVMTEGNWRLGTVVDAKASDEQAEKLQAVFSGELGGPMAALGPLIGENLGVQRAPIEVRDDGLRHSVRIGDATGFDVEDVVPFGVETGEPARVTGIFHPAGSEFRVAKATSADISLFGIEYQGKSGIVRTALVGALMTFVLVATQSLLTAMVLHALIDGGSGLVTWIALREEPTSPVPIDSVSRTG